MFSAVGLNDRPLRAAVRREQSLLAHEAQHPVTADAEAIEGAQAGPDLAVPLAGEGRAIEVAADRREQPRIVDHRARPAPPARGRRLGDRPAGVEGGARHAPGGATLQAGDGPRVRCRATLQGNLIPKECVPNKLSYTPRKDPRDGSAPPRSCPKRRTSHVNWREPQRSLQSTRKHTTSSGSTNPR